MRASRALVGLLVGALLAGFGPFRRGDEQAAEELAAAQAQIAAGDLGAAVGTLRSLRLNYQDTPAGLEGTVLLGQLLLQQGDAAGALTAAQGALQSPDLAEPAARDAHLVAGLALHGLGQDDEARLHLAPLEGKLTSEADLRRLATAMAEITAAAGDAVEEVRWQVMRLTVTPEAQQAALRERVQGLILDSLSPADLDRLAAEYQSYYPADYVLYARVRAALRAQDFPAATQLADQFLAAWPQHPQAHMVALAKERAGRQDAMEPTRIGVILPLTGKFSAPGQAVRRGMELALSQVPSPAWAGGKVQLIFRDTEGDEARAAQAVKELVLTDRVAAIIGPLTSAEALAPAQVAQDLEIPLITLTQREGIPQIGPFVFRNFPTPERQTAELVRFLAEEMGVKRLGILYPENRYGTTTADLVWDAALADGIEVTAAQPYPPGTEDFGPTAQEIAGKLWTGFRQDELRSLRWKAQNDPDNKRDPATIELPALVDYDALFIADHYRTSALLAQSLAYVEIPIGRFNVDKRAPIPLIGLNSWNNPELPRIGGDYMIGATFVADFYAGSTAPQTQAFVAAWRKTYGGVPETFAAHGYDSVAVLLQALGDEAPRSRDELRDRLDAITGFQGVTGTFSFGPDGELEREPYILRVSRKKTIVQVYPPEASAAPTAKEKAR